MQIDENISEINYGISHLRTNSCRALLSD